MTRLARGPLPDPANAVKPGDTVTLTYTRDGKTYAQVMQVTSVSAFRGVSGVNGEVTHEGFLEGIDRRLDNQRQSIDSLLGHLNKHCPKLLGVGQCEEIGK